MSDSDPSPAAIAVVSGGAAARTPWNPIHADSVPLEISSRIEAELIALVYGNIKTALAGQLAAVVLIGFAAWSVVPSATGAGWILALLIVVTVRWRLAREFHSAPARSWQPRVWRRRAISGSAATGVLWGLGGLLLVRYGDSSHQALSGFVLGGLTAGAVATTSPVRAAYVVLSVPMMFLLAAAYLLWGGSLALPMSGLSLIFLLAMLRTARQMHDTFEHDVRMRLANEQLVSSLTSTAESLSRSNQELGREVEERGRAEEARRRSESSLKEAQRIGRIASWVIELPSNRLYGSEQLARLFEDDAVLDTTFGWVVERTHPDDREALRRTYEEAIASRGPVEIVQRVIMPDGRVKYLRDRGEVVRDAEGCPVQLIGTAQDITEQRQAEEQLRLSAQVFEGGVEGVMITDANGRILSVNRAFTDITGYSQEEALGKNPRLLQSGMHDAAFYRRIWTALEAVGHWRGELWDRRKSGEVFPAWFAISSVKPNFAEVIEGVL